MKLRQELESLAHRKIVKAKPLKTHLSSYHVKGYVCTIY